MSNGYSSVWLGGSADTGGLRDLLLLQQNHRCAECGDALDGYVFFAMPLANGATVAVCNSCMGRLSRLRRQAQRL
jgi:uncharacterized membrane protein YedE/YeeE